MFKIKQKSDAHSKGVVWDLCSDDGDFVIFRRTVETRRGFEHSTRREVERHADLEWARGRLFTLAGHVV